MTSRSAIVVTASIFATLVVGCAASEPGDDDARVSVDTSVAPQWSPPLTGGVCPDPALGSTEKTEWYQAKATSVMQYLVGGKDPFTPDEVMYNPACKEAQINATNLRNMISPSSSKIAATAVLQAAYSDKVCGLPAALYALDISSQISPSAWDAQKKTGQLLDKCWGVGVSGFYYADPTQDKTRRIYIDPEPARLTTDLYGSTGATAAAVYTNTGAATNVIKWPSSYTWSSSPPPAGTPCSNGDVPWGTETLKLIQGSGSYRRCY